MPRDGAIGEQIYEQVEKLVADGMNRTQAFAHIAGQTGRQAGTVAANYYRVARKKAGGPLRTPRTAAPRAKPPKSKSTRRSRPATTAHHNIDEIASDLVANAQALAKALKAQDAEISDLRARLDGVRTVLG